MPSEPGPKKICLKPLEKIYRFRPMGRRMIGLDFGGKRIGVAVCGPDHKTASAVQTIIRRNLSLDLQELHSIIKDYEASGLIFGWPLNQDGQPGPMCERVRSFADETLKHPDIRCLIQWAAYFDERLSTKSVDEFLVKSVDMSRTKRKQVIDKLAAQRILQNTLDYIHFQEMKDISDT